MGSTRAERDGQIGRTLAYSNTFADETPQHEVEISPFECMAFPVTRRLYALVMRDDPLRRYFEYAQRAGYATDDWSKEPDECPVVWVRWLDAILFCNFLSARSGLTPCYAVSGSGRYSTESDATTGNAAMSAKVEWIRSSNGYRLPTEAEWEYVCRAGTTTPWFHGDDSTELSRYAWYDESQQSTEEYLLTHTRPRCLLHEVRRKLPNPWGIYDMIGNAAEWCGDSRRAYSTDRARNPEGPPSNRKAIRGGGGVLAHTRCAARSEFIQYRLSSGLGFRCVRGVPD
jgi:formylglycine-generating enzyme required for sulfatase activity